MADLTSMRLRRAEAADIGFVMATERLAGYDWFIGRWDEDRHRETIALPANAYLIAEDAAGVRHGFAILRQLDDPERNAYLQRIAVVRPGGGLGRWLLGAVARWVFTQTDAHRLWLQVKDGNDRARHIYAASGFTEEGRLREAHVAPDGSRSDAFVLSMLRAEWSSGRASATT